LTQLPGSVWMGFVRIIDVRRGVSKRVEDGHRPATLQVGHPRNSHKAVSGVACPQGIEGLGMVGPGETSGNPWPPLPIYPWSGWVSQVARTLNFCFSYFMN
jgi:hypothetical protein